MEARMIQLTEDIIKEWTKTHTNPLLASQKEILKSFIFWREIDIHTVPIKHLYLYPQAGATTLWLCVEKCFSDILLVPLKHKQLATDLYSVTFSIEEAVFEGNTYGSLIFKSKIIIVDGLNTERMSKQTALILRAGAKGVFLS